MEKGNGKERSKWIAPKVKFKKTNKKKTETWSLSGIWSRVLLSLGYLGIPPISRL